MTKVVRHLRRTVAGFELADVSSLLYSNSVRDILEYHDHCWPQKKQPNP